MSSCKARINLCVLALAMSFNVLAESRVIGATYAIAESDALTEIESKVKAVDWEKALSKSKTDWGGAQSIHLPETTEYAERNFVPWYTLPFNITGKDGRVIYPRGFAFNPLTYTKLPNKIAISSAKNASTVLSHIGPYDMLLVTNGNPYKLAKKLKRPVFILDAKTKKRLGVRVQPSIISQVNAHLRIVELVPEEALNEK